MDSNCKMIARAVVNTGTGTLGPEKAVDAVLTAAGLERKEIDCTVVTGYGRITYTNADKQITEISCHAKGAFFLAPETRTVIDIGGQDAKIIRLDQSDRVENFVMNDKCAAGTGRFLEVMARILDCRIDELSKLADKAETEINISNTCTVFAESEVISQLAAGAQRASVARGAHRAVAKRIAGLASRIGIKPEIFLTGGVALNSDVADALEKELGEKITTAKDPQIVGAVGAALYAVELHRSQSL